VETGTARFIADWRQLRRWGLDERRLPPGTEVPFRTPSTWERYGHLILVALGVIAAQSFLLAWLLVEHRRRRRAQAALEEQARYERTIAELTNDAVRYAADDAPRALEDALSRIGQYAGADTAVLVQRSDSPSRPATRVQWTRETESGNGDDAFAGDDFSPGTPGPGPLGGSRLELPLVVGAKAVGAVELYRWHSGEWPAQFVARLGPVAELLAAAIARSNAARAADEASRQLAHLGRVAAVGELAVAISHELRQPLTAIRSNAEVGVHLLEGPAPDVHEARQVFGEIVADDKRATEVIEQIRLLLRKQEPGTTAVDLNEVCRHATPLLARDARIRGVQLSLELRADPSTVMANAAEMQQVVLNLVLNALDALATHVGRREVVIGTSTRPKSVELFVRDTGPGLPPEVQARLFESFFSTKPHGLGVGLSIVRSIVERFHGRVFAENPREGGAEFRVTLPATAHALGAPGRAKSPPPPGAPVPVP
jgi:C4-dicarboxylate-specific signal transduction histidine kinase